MSDARDPLRAWLSLLDVSNALRKSIDARMRERFGLSLSRFDVLAALDRAGQNGFNGGALSTHLKVTEGATTQVTTPLIAAGLVKRSTSPRDGRVAIFSLTAKGRKIFAAMAQANLLWVSEAFGELSPVQLQDLRRLLVAIKPLNTAAGRGPHEP